MIEEPTLEQLRTGDSEAYTKIYEAYRDSFLGYARKYELSEEDVLEIYQDSVVKLYENVMSRKLNKLTSSLKTYLFTHFIAELSARVSYLMLPLRTGLIPFATFVN